MIEILSKTDIEKVQDKRVKDYLEFSFNKLPKDFIYGEYGYFVYIQSINDLEDTQIHLSTITLPNIENGLFGDVELVEIHDEIMEVVILIDNDFGVSLIIPIEVLENGYKDKLKEYIQGYNI